MLIKIPRKRAANLTVYSPQILTILMSWLKKIIRKVKRKSDASLQLYRLHVAPYSPLDGPVLNGNGGERME